MGRYHVYTDAITGEVTEVPFTPEEEAEWDAMKPPVPASISDRQFFQQLAVIGAITQQEAKDAVKTGEIPQAMQAVIDDMDEADRFAAEMIVSGAVEYRRDHNLVAVFANAMGWTSDQVDDLFRAASAL
jgi:hypothetical protein